MTGAFVSVSASAGMMLSAAAIMSAGDVKKRTQLPATTGMKNEAIAQAVNRNPYHNCVLPAGMAVRCVGDSDRPAAAKREAGIALQTACRLYFINCDLEGRQLPLSTVTEVCHRNGLAVIVDAAQFPAFENTWRFTQEMGVDIAAFSDGNEFRGPQSSGVVLGKAAIIEQIMAFGPPTHSIDRHAKAGRESIVDLMTAVEIV